MSTVQVELKPLAELFADLAIEMGWCGEAEEVFEDATRVAFLSIERICGGLTCYACPPLDGQPARFTLPADAPKFVPEAPIIEILQERWEDTVAIDECGDPDCYCDTSKMLRALRELAEALPSKPKFSS